VQTTTPVTSCPHCGGNSGLLTNVVFKAVRMAKRDGQDVDTDSYVMTSETNPKCADCGKPVRKLFRPQ
jgi:hypothetical protein